MTVAAAVLSATGGAAVPLRAALLSSGGLSVLTALVAGGGEGDVEAPVAVQAGALRALREVALAAAADSDMDTGRKKKTKKVDARVELTTEEAAAAAALVVAALAAPARAVRVEAAAAAAAVLDNSSSGGGGGPLAAVLTAAVEAAHAVATDSHALAAVLTAAAAGSKAAATTARAAVLQVVVHHADDAPAAAARVLAALASAVATEEDGGVVTSAAVVGALGAAATTALRTLRETSTLPVHRAALTAQILQVCAYVARCVTGPPPCPPWLHVLSHESKVGSPSGQHCSRHPAASGQSADSCFFWFFCRHVNSTLDSKHGC